MSHSLPVSRRFRIYQGLALVGLALTAASTQAQTLVPLDWPCDVVRLGSDDRFDRSPVITGIAVQPQGNLVAVVGDDHRVRLCDRFTGELVHRLEGHRDWVRRVAFTPDGTTLITAGNDRTVLRWDAATGSRLGTALEVSFPVAALAISPAGDQFAIAGFSNQVLIHQISDGARVTSFQASCPDLRALDYSPDGQQLAVGGRDGRLRIWNLVSGELEHDLPLHRRRLRDLEYQADANTIVTCGEDQRIRIVDLRRPDAAMEIDSTPAKVLSVASIGPKLLASAGSDNQIRIWDLMQLREVGQLYGHQGTVTSLVFDGERLYSAGYDTHLRIWRANANFARMEEGSPRIGRQPGVSLD